MRHFLNPWRCRRRCPRGDAGRCDRPQGRARRLATRPRRWRCAARRAHAGDGVRKEFHAHPRQFRHGDPAAWRHVDRDGCRIDAIGARRKRGGYRARPVRLCRCDHDPHRRSCQGGGDGALRQRPRHQRPDRRIASLPDRRRPADHRRERAHAAWSQGRVAGRWQQRARLDRRGGRADAFRRNCRLSAGLSAGRGGDRARKRPCAGGQ